MSPLLKALSVLALRRPGLACRLMAEAVRDRLGRHRESEDEHLLSVLRHVAASGLQADFDAGDNLVIGPRPGGTSLEYRLRLRDSDVRVFREVVVHEEYRAALPGLLSGRKDPWIVDAGGNVGLVTLFLKGRVPGARVVALEPDAANAARFRGHVDANRLGGVRVLEAALWPTRTRLRFVPSEASGPSWGFRVESCADGPVQAIPPGELMAEAGIDQVDLLKLDVEGSEFPLLEDPAAEEWLARVKAVIAEVHPQFGDVARLEGVLRRAGFAVRDLGANLLYADRTG